MLRYWVRRSTRYVDNAIYYLQPHQIHVLDAWEDVDSVRDRA